MVALSIPWAAGVAIPPPTLGQLVGGGVDIVGHHLVACIDAAGKEDAGVAPIEARCAEEVFRGTVPAVILRHAPRLGIVGLAAFIERQRIGDALVGLARQSVHVEQIFALGGHKPVGAAAGGGTYVDRGVAYGVGGAVGHVDDGAVGGTHHCLGASVTVPVIGDDVLLVVLEVAHVGAAVHPPEAGAVEFEAFEDGVFALVTFPGVGGIHLALVVELHQDFQLPVAIDVGAGGVIGDEAAFDALVLQFDFLVTGAPGGDGLAWLLLLAAHHGAYGVAARGAAARVLEVGHAERFVVQFRAVAIHVVGHVVVLLAQYSPSEIDARARLHGHQAAVQHVACALCHGRHRQTQQEKQYGRFLCHLDGDWFLSCLVDEMFDVVVLSQSILGRREESRLYSALTLQKAQVSVG